MKSNVMSQPSDEQEIGPFGSIYELQLRYVDLSK
jgi:hypothetical protein